METDLDRKLDHLGATALRIKAHRDRLLNILRSTRKFIELWRADAAGLPPTPGSLAIAEGE